jgi:hypothetical protein
MFSSNSPKIIFLAGLLCLSACSLWKEKPDAAVSPPVFVAEEIKSAIPFSSKEPDVYQTEIVVTAAANNSEDKTFVARNGENRLIVFNFQSDSEISVLQLGEQRAFYVAANKKIYAELETRAKSEEASDFFTAEWLSQKTNARFETLPAENDFARFRVNLDEAENSEIIVYVNEKIGLPVRQEFYSIGGEQKTLTLTMELKNYNAQTEAKLFEVPKDYRKVSLKEFQEIIKPRLKRE